MQFPKFKYHATKKPELVHSEDAEKSLGAEWKDSPADHGHETHPGVLPDPKIQAVREKAVSESAKATKKA